jgi:hypothetical protein
VTKTFGVSLTFEDHSTIMKRIEALKPHVGGFSHYFQRLAALDLEQGLLGPSLLGKRVLAAGS